MEIQKNTHRTTSVAAATAYGDASRSCGCGLECATPMLTRRRDHDVDRPDGHEYLMIYVGRGKDNRAPSSGLLLLGTALRRRRQRAWTWCSTKASATVRATVGEVELCFSAIRRRAFSFSARRWRGRATARAASCVLDWSDGKGCRGSFIREWRRFPLYMIGSVDKIYVISGGDCERRG